MGDFVSNDRTDGTKVGGGTKVQCGGSLGLHSNVKVDCVGALRVVRLRKRFHCTVVDSDVQCKNKVDIQVLGLCDDEETDI